MKKRSSFAGHGILSHFGTFFLLFISFGVMGTAVCGIIYPDVETIPEPVSFYVINGALAVSLFVTIMKAVIPQIGQFIFSRKDISPEEKLLRSAMDIIIETDQASISMLQRKLNLDYSHASEIMQALEARGYIGPHNGFAPRPILITKSKWCKLRIK